MNSMTARALGFLAAVAVLASVEGTAEGSSAGSAAKLPPATIVKIGGVCDLSGPSTPFGNACKDGLGLAVQQIDRAGGFYVGKKRYVLQLTVKEALRFAVRFAACSVKAKRKFS